MRFVSTGVRKVLDATALAALAVAAVVGLPGPEAAAGGMDQMYPVQDRYEPGETATMVGYTVRSTDPQVWEHADPDVLDWSDTGPFHGYLRVDSRWPEGGPMDRQPGLLPTDVDLGEPAVNATDPGADGYAPVRVSLTFRLPADLQAGAYLVGITDQWGSRYLGHLDASWIYVGIDPIQPVIRAWPHAEPAIVDLDPGALLWDGDLSGTVTAAELRSGGVPSLPTGPTTAAGPGHDDAPAGTDRTTPRDGAADDADGRESPDRGEDDGGDLIAAAAPAGEPGGTEIGGFVPWLLGLVGLVGLWCAARRRSRHDRDVATELHPGPDLSDPPGVSASGPASRPRANRRRSPRKRVSRPAPDTDQQPGLRSDQPVRFRL
ncbi:MAG: hypothetical protein ACRD2C_10050 [Acidimicrobiales bacterium]